MIDRIYFNQTFKKLKKKISLQKKKLHRRSLPACANKLCEEKRAKSEFMNTVSQSFALTTSDEVNIKFYAFHSVVW